VEPCNKSKAKDDMRKKEL